MCIFYIPSTDNQKSGRTTRNSNLDKHLFFLNSNATFLMTLLSVRNFSNLIFQLIPFIFYILHNIKRSSSAPSINPDDEFTQNKENSMAIPRFKRHLHTSINRCSRKKLKSKSYSDFALASSYLQIMPR